MVDSTLIARLDFNFRTDFFCISDNLFFVQIGYQFEKKYGTLQRYYRDCKIRFTILVFLKEFTVVNAPFKWQGLLTDRYSQIFKRKRVSCATEISAVGIICGNITTGPQSQSSPLARSVLTVSVFLLPDLEHHAAIFQHNEGNTRLCDL